MCDVYCVLYNLKAFFCLIFSFHKAPKTTSTKQPSKYMCVCKNTYACSLCACIGAL